MKSITFRDAFIQSKYLQCNKRLGLRDGKEDFFSNEGKLMVAFSKRIPQKYLGAVRYLRLHHRLTCWRICLPVSVLCMSASLSSEYLFLKNCQVVLTCYTHLPVHVIAVCFSVHHFLTAWWSQDNYCWLRAAACRSTFDISVLLLLKYGRLLFSYFPCT